MKVCKVCGTSPAEAEYFAKDIDLDKWQFIDGDYEIVDVSKDFFLKRVKVEQDVELSNQISEKDQI